MAQVRINPISRMKGQWEAWGEEEQGKMKSVRVSGLSGREFLPRLVGCSVVQLPFFAQHLCGDCGFAHSLACCRAVEEGSGLGPGGKEERLRCLLEALEAASSHMMYFYWFVLPDYLGEEACQAGRVSREAAGRVLRGREEASRLRRLSREGVALLTGKGIHGPGMFPGRAGVPDDEEQFFFGKTLEEMTSFWRERYSRELEALERAWPELGRWGKSEAAFLDFGFLDRCPEGPLCAPGFWGRQGRREPRAENIGADFSRCWSQAAGGQAVAFPWFLSGHDYGKQGAQGWIPAAYYGGEACEVGPLARRVLSENRRREANLLERLRACHWETGRLLELGRVILAAGKGSGWHEERKALSSLPSSGKGVGTAATAEGSLLYFVRWEEGRCRQICAVTPSMWNMTPHRGKAPAQQALEGAAAQERAAGRILRGFSPCGYCGGM